MKNAWLPLKMFQRAELEPPSLIAMRKLSKRDVEALLVEYDNNPIASLHAALGVLIPNCPAGWEEAVDLLPIDKSRKQLLRHGNVVALDALVQQLVETRCL